MKRQHISAIIFDFDGVLADTMDANHRAWTEACAALGMSLDRKAYLLREGMTTHALAATLLAEHGLPDQLGPGLVAAKERAFKENHIPGLFAGTLELLDTLSRRLPLGLASGASSERLQNSTSNDFRRHFQATVCGDEVSRGKPDPEPYLLAAKRLGLPPGQCLAVENAPLGIRAARAAGMGCVAVCSTLEARHLKDAAPICPDIPALHACLLQMDTGKGSA